MEGNPGRARLFACIHKGSRWQLTTELSRQYTGGTVISEGVGGGWEGGGGGLKGHRDRFDHTTCTTPGVLKVNV